MDNLKQILKDLMYNLNSINYSVENNFNKLMKILYLDKEMNFFRVKIIRPFVIFIGKKIVNFILTFKEFHYNVIHYICVYLYGNFTEVHVKIIFVTWFIIACIISLILLSIYFFFFYIICYYLIKYFKYYIKDFLKNIKEIFIEIKRRFFK